MIVRFTTRPRFFWPPPRPYSGAEAQARRSYGRAFRPLSLAPREPPARLSTDVDCAFDCSGSILLLLMIISLARFYLLTPPSPAPPIPSKAS